MYLQFTYHGHPHKFKDHEPFTPSNGPQLGSVGGGKRCYEASAAGLPWLSTVGIYFWKADGGPSLITSPSRKIGERAFQNCVAGKV